jgi:serine protease DegQ
LRDLMRRFAAVLTPLLVIAALLPAAPTRAGIPILPTANGQTVPTLSPVIKRVAAGVVSIVVRAPAGQQQTGVFDDPMLRQMFGLPDLPRGSEIYAGGSGVIIDSRQGYIVTNNHVVENADQITVTLLDGRQLPAMLEGADPDTDIALLKVRADNLTALPLGDSDRLEVGDFVLAIGNPFGVGQTVTSGIVSGLRRTGMGLDGFEDFIQTDASINPGNSGGALVNLSGELVGVNSAIVGPNGGNVGIGFAIPSNMVRGIADQLVKYGAVERGELGLGMASLTAELAQKWHLAPIQSGVVATRVEPNSAAEHAGLKAGDLITELNAASVRDVQDLRNKLGMLRVGDPALLTVQRNGRSMRIKATMTEPTPKTVDGQQLTSFFEGALFAPTPSGARERGVQVATVRAGSQAWNSGLREGDVITAVNQKSVTGIDQFIGETGQAAQGVRLNITRDGEKLLVAIRMNESVAPKAAVR